MVAVLERKMAKTKATSKSVVAQSIAEAEELTASMYDKLSGRRGEGEQSKAGDRVTSVEDYVREGRTSLRCGDYGIVTYECHCLNAWLGISPEGIVFDFPDSPSLKSFVAQLSKSAAGISNLLGVVVAGKGKRLSIVKDGDRGEFGGIRHIDDEPTVSFQCLSRFFRSTPSTLVGLEIIRNGTVLDFSGDETRRLTESERSRISKIRKKVPIVDRANLANVVPPEPGFVLVGNSVKAAVWHRSGNFLVKHLGATILLGVDERAYFGCELSKRVKTIAQAFESLIPPEARKVNCERQGEWFAVPIAKEDVPEIDSPEVLAIYQSDDSCGCGASGFALSIDHPYAARHFITGKHVFVTAKGVIANNPTLTHSGEEHKEMYLTGWFKFVRNTAKRSFSEQGVD